MLRIFLSQTIKNRKKSATPTFYSFIEEVTEVLLHRTSFTKEIKEVFTEGYAQSILLVWT